MRSLLFTTAVSAHMCLTGCALGCNEAAYRQATLTALSDAQLYPIDTGACGWIETCEQSTIDLAKARANQIRAFAETVSDACAKSAYLGWANFVDSEADRGLHEMQTHESRDAYELLEKAREATDHEAERLLGSIPKP